ncbi:MAG: putative bifunctional diguanylate cyclase/phosphodiesterase [Gammaproteobacteria bacterium]
MKLQRLQLKQLLLAVGLTAGTAIILSAILLTDFRVFTDELRRLAVSSNETTLRDGLLSRAQLTALDTADRLAAPLAAEDPASIFAIADIALARDDVRRLVITDSAGAVVLDTAAEEPNAAPIDPALEEPLWTDDTLLVSAPVRAAGSELGRVQLTLSLDSLNGALGNVGRDIREVDRRQLKRSLVLIVITSGILTIIGMLFARHGAQRIIVPLRELTRRAALLSQAPPEERLQMRRKDELSELAQALDAIIRELKKTSSSRDYLDKLLASMNDAVIVISPDGIIKRVNQSTMTMFGYSEPELLGQPLQSLLPEDRQLDLSVSQMSVDVLESTFVTRTGRHIPVSLSSSPISTDDPQFEGKILVARDITERKKAEKRIRFLAHYDPLTKVPNRMQFQHLLQQAIARARRQRHGVALLYIDLDRFKDINDTFGHLAGDTSLETATARLLAAVPKGAIVGRLAGDEFAVILDRLNAERNVSTEVAQVAHALLRSLGHPFRVQDSEVFLTASIGIATYPADADNVIDLIRNADAAMYHAKQIGGNNFECYTPEMNAQAVDRLMMKSKLRRAFERNELMLQYQPKYDLSNGVVVGAEALLRWELPGHGTIGPSEFIPLAEETNMILDIGEWVLDRVCSDYKLWQSSIPSPGRVAVNFSLKQLRQTNIRQRIATILGRHGVAPQRLELEITETTLMQDAERTVGILRELFAMGLHLSIDDFGTGYSSLSSLQQFPIGTLKIDRSFVRDAATDPDDATIVSMIIDMGRSLNMEVVAEGVENEEQLSFLRKRRCNYAQGHLFGDPMSADDYLELLLQQQQGTDRYLALFA